VAERREGEKLCRASHPTNCHVTTATERTDFAVMIAISQLIQDFISNSSKKGPVELTIVATFHYFSKDRHMCAIAFTIPTSINFNAHVIATRTGVERSTSNLKLSSLPHPEISNFEDH